MSKLNVSIQPEGLDPQQSSLFTSSYSLCLAESKFSLLVCRICVEFLVVSVYPISILIRPMGFWIISRAVSTSESPKINGMLAMPVTLWVQLIFKRKCHICYTKSLKYNRQFRHTSKQKLFCGLNNI